MLFAVVLKIDLFALHDDHDFPVYVHLVKFDDLCSVFSRESDRASLLYGDDMQCRGQNCLDACRIFVEDTKGEGMASQGYISRVNLCIRVCHGRENLIKGRVRIWV